MKYPIIVFISFFLIKATHAQTSPSPDNKIMIDNIKTVKPQSVTEFSAGATFLFNTDKGKVYALPQDNMPCLVPNIKSNMPVVQLNIEGLRKIPNAIPEYKIIPENKSPLTSEK